MRLHQPGLFDDELPEPPNPWGFTDGDDCPIPTRWPTCGGSSRNQYQTIKAVSEHDWRYLKSLPMRWWCQHCNQWHNFSANFFKRITFELWHKEWLELWHKMSRS